MNCETAQPQIVLYLYGELSDEAAHSLETHLAECPECRREVQVVQALQQAMSLTPREEPSANLLASSRIRLEEALDTLPAHSPIDRVRNLISNWGQHLRTAPVLTGLLLAAGFISGHVTGTIRATNQQTQHPAINLSNQNNGAIANITGIIPTPNSEVVQVNYNRIVPESMQGSLDDPQIRQLLLIAARSRTISAHDDSVGLLAEECRNGHDCGNDADGNPVRNALMVALHYDKSASVRLKALEGLQPYIAEDSHVRDAVLEALMHDDSAQVRTEAISLISPVGADSSVQQVLHSVSERDNDPGIRSASQQLLHRTAALE